MRTRFTIALAFTLALTAVPVAANTSGPMYISADTTLTEDHDGRIEIVADNVTLDCAGHLLTGPGRLGGVPGVYLGNRTGVTVKNCVLTEFNSGFLVQQSSNNTFADNHVSRVRQGFTIQDSDGNRLEGNSVYDANDWFGFGFVEGSSDNVVTGNSASGTSPVGFVVTQGATGNTFTHNDSSNNLGEGFAVHNDPGTSGNAFSGNSAHNNKGPGFIDSTAGGAGDYGTDNIYSNNICIGNSDPSSPQGVCNPSGTFTDDDGNVFEFDIEWMAWEGITKGCNPPTNDLYCPDAYVTRGQMAAFLVRALGYTDDGGGNLFIDDDSSIFEADIDRLGTAGVTRGCNPPDNDRFCPDAYVTRGQMAAFLVRALGYTDDGGGNLFVDDDASVFEGDIDRLGTAGVTKGCNPPTNDRFCPDDYVTRGQMAAFLHRALG